MIRTSVSFPAVVIARIAGCGIKVLREDMSRLLQTMDGEFFTFATMPLPIDEARIREYKTR